MATIAELLAMQPKDVYAAAVRLGIERASKAGSFPVITGEPQQKELNKWFAEHPEFFDEKVYDLLTIGLITSFNEVVDKMRGVANAIGILNLGGGGESVEWIPLSPDE